MATPPSLIPKEMTRAVSDVWQAGYGERLLSERGEQARVAEHYAKKYGFPLLDGIAEEVRRVPDYARGNGDAGSACEAHEAWEAAAEVLVVELIKLHPQEILMALRARASDSVLTGIALSAMQSVGGELRETMGDEYRSFTQMSAPGVDLSRPRIASAIYELLGGVSPKVTALQEAFLTKLEPGSAAWEKVHEIRDDQLARLKARQERSEVEVAIVRRARAPMAHAWFEQVKPVLTIGVILFLAANAESLPARLGVLGLAVAYALFRLGHEERKDGHQEIAVEVDTFGVRQRTAGRVVEADWDEFASYATPPLSLDTVGLCDQKGSVRVCLDPGSNQGNEAVVANLQWRLLGEAVRSRLPFAQTKRDVDWNRTVRHSTLRLAYSIVAIMMFIFPQIMRVASKTGHLSTGFVLFGIVLVFPIFVLPSLLSVNSGDSLSTVLGSAESKEDKELEAFVRDRKGALDQVALHVGKEYRYVDPKRLSAKTSSLLRTSGTWFPIGAMLQAAMLVNVDPVLYGVLGYVLLIEVFGVLRLWEELKILRARRASFSVEGDELVVRWRKRVERYPRASARLRSVVPTWCEFGGEVEEYRAGWRRVMVDRRFLVPVDAEPSSDTP